MRFRSADFIGLVWMEGGIVYQIYDFKNIRIRVEALIIVYMKMRV